MDPLKCFVINQKKYDVYVRIVDASKKNPLMVASQFFKNEEIYAVAIDHHFKRDSYIDIDERYRLHLECDKFRNHIVIFKINMELLKE